jgi:hypothetical protein
VGLLAGGGDRSGGAGGRSSGRREKAAIEGAGSGDERKRSLVPAVDFEAEDGVVDRGKLPNGGNRRQDAVLGVSAAAMGRIEMRQTERRVGVSAAVIEQLVERGQAGAAAQEQREQQQGVQPVPQVPTHAKSLPGAYRHCLPACAVVLFLFSFCHELFALGHQIPDIERLEERGNVRRHLPDVLSPVAS